MKNLPNHLASLALTLWIGGLWVVGYLAVPTLFYSQPDRQLAGMLAGKMFETLGYVGLLCGLYLLFHRWMEVGKQVSRDVSAWLLIVMLLITLVTQLYIQPLMADMKFQALPLDVMQSAFAGQFKMWHGISSILYLIESLLGAWLVIRSFNVSSK
ncbi:MAG: DUF4149 domain-containing protein [Sideroxydans sp.]|nr:DUF4149 domain-containing protein [Sideroxydans sp.]